MAESNPKVIFVRHTDEIVFTDGKETASINGGDLMAKLTEPKVADKVTSPPPIESDNKVSICKGCKKPHPGGKAWHAGCWNKTHPHECVACKSPNSSTKEGGKCARCYYNNKPGNTSTSSDPPTSSEPPVKP